jgi:type IV pilus secretin PilQ/predicted competence protein
MRFNRLLMAGLMALICAGTATASQLNSVHVTPKANAATVTLQTTGSFAHKEYRPDDHLLLIDLTGVTSDASLAHATAVKSSVLKSYTVSTYTNAAGTTVTRLQLSLGDKVTSDVVDATDGLRILLSAGTSTATAPAKAPAAAAKPASPASASTAAGSKPAPAQAAGTKPAAAQKMAPNATADAAKLAKSNAPAHPAGDSQPSAAAPEKARSQAPLTTIRGLSVKPEQGALDIIIEGPSAASPYLLKHPERLVMDFRNATLQPSVKGIAVDTRDVLQVRVGRPQASVARVVVDLVGPRAFEVAPEADRVVVRVRAEAAAKSAPSSAAAEPTVAKAKENAKPAPSSASAVPPAAERAAAHPRGSRDTAAASAPRVKQVAMTTAVSAPAASENNGRAAAKEVFPSMVTVSASAPAVEKAPSAGNTPGTQAGAVVDPAPAAAPAAKQAVTTVASNAPAPGSAASAPTIAPVIAAAMPAPASPAPSEKPVETARLVAPVTNQVPESIASAGDAAATATPRYTGEPISVNLKDVDLKDFFRLIHEISGLNVVLDPSVHGSVTLVLDDVPWDQALDIVLKINSLDRELEGNVLRIAAKDTLRREAVERRAQAEAVALAVDRQTITRTLSYARAAMVMPTIRKFLTARGDVISDDRTNSLIISDIPSVLPTLDRLISQLDKKSQEVEIEVRVVSATRSFSRDLGFQLGFNWGNGSSVVAGTNPNAAISSPIIAPGSTTTTGGTGPVTTINPIPLFSNFPATGATTGIGFSNITKNYGIDAILTAAESHNLAKVLSRPRVVTQSNVKAVVKQGVELPVYTAGTQNINSSVTYVDAVLRLTVTPQITADNTIFLSVDVENTQPNGQLNGNYILQTQQETTQVLVSDGGTVMIGGVIQTSNSVSTQQTPLLGDIPWLGNLFKERSVHTETDELIFFITPKIIQT